MTRFSSFSFLAHCFSVFIALFFLFLFAQSATVSAATAADEQKGDAHGYTNPIINADYSDPDVCVVGDDYYLTASSFVNSPGLPVLHSTDLVNWEIIN